MGFDLAAEARALAAETIRGGVWFDDAQSAASRLVDAGLYDGDEDDLIATLMHAADGIMKQLAEILEAN